MIRSARRSIPGHARRSPGSSWCPMALGARLAPPDVAIVSVKADPPQVFQGAEAPIEVVVQVSGLPARDIPVRLDRPGAEPMEQIISHDGVTSIYRVRFRPKLEEV